MGSQGEEENSKEPGTITRWIREFQNGDVSSFSKLWENYFPRLTDSLLGKLRCKVGCQFDGEDVASMSLEILHNLAVSKRMPDIRDSEGLWRLLVFIAHRKVSELKRFENRLKRTQCRIFAQSEVDELLSVSLEKVRGKDPTAEALAIFEETYASLMILLDPAMRAIAVDLLQGFSPSEIADKLEVPVCVIDRKLKRIRSKWSRFSLSLRDETVLCK